MPECSAIHQPLFSAQRCCADTSMTCLDPQYCNDIAYWEISFGQCSDTCTHNPQSKRLGSRLDSSGTCWRWTLQAYIKVLIAAGPSNKTLHKFPAHMLYCSRIFFWQHVWLFSNIESKTQDQLTDSQIQVPLKLQLIDYFEDIERVRRTALLLQKLKFKMEFR